MKDMYVVGPWHLGMAQRPSLAAYEFHRSWPSLTILDVFILLFRYNIYFTDVVTFAL